MFITFEGIEGCGKSTQVERIARRLEILGIPVVVTREPGGTPIGEHIRHILLSSRNQDLTPLAELFLYEADRAQHMTQVVRPALARKEWVLCDRFFDATTAYQGYARAQDLAMTLQLNAIASFGMTPDMTFLLDLPVSVGIKRALKRNEASAESGQDRFEKEQLKFHKAVREGYLDLARKNRKRFVVLDADQEIAKLEDVIFSHLKPHLPPGN